MNRYVKASVFATINIFVIYFIWSNLTEYTGPIIAVTEGHGQVNDSGRVVKVIDAPIISESSESYIEYMKNEPTSIVK